MNLKIIVLTGIAFAFVHCKQPSVVHKQQLSSVDSTLGLKDYFKNFFTVGVAVGPNNLTGDESKLILQQFNSITAENAMKMGPIHPRENEYYWKDADAIVNFAQNKSKFR